MVHAILKNKLFVIIICCLVLALSCSNAFAWGHRGYYWHGDRWWGPGWFGFDVAVSALAIGAMVEALPRGYATVVVNGAPYYYYDNVYYRPYAGGYVVVQEPINTYQVVQSPGVVESAAPVVQTQATVAESTASYGISANTEEEFTVNIPNARGGYTPVTLRRSGNGFIGPQGEFYPEFPKISLLKVMYGK